MIIWTVIAQSTDRLDVSETFNAPIIISGVLCILIGLIILFFGYRFLKVLLFIAGFYIFSIIGYSILTKTNAGDGNPSVLLWGSIGIGLLGGFLAIFIYRLGIALLGALGGMTIALWILSLKGGGLLTDQTQRTIFIVIFAIVGSIVIQFAEKPIIIIFSSFSGAYSICYGIDTFTKLGYVDRLKEVYNAGSSIENLKIEAKEVGWQLGLLLAANILLFILGSWYQFRSNRDRNHSKSIL